MRWVRTQAAAHAKLERLAALQGMLDCHGPEKVRKMSRNLQRGQVTHLELCDLLILETQLGLPLLILSSQLLIHLHLVLQIPMQFLRLFIQLIPLLLHPL